VHTALQPYFRREYLLSTPEKYFYNILREIFGNCAVLAKVRLADLIEANERHPQWQANFNRIRSKHVDFFLCDNWLRPLLAIELDGSSHRRIDRQQRDILLDEILATASLPIAHVPRRRRYFHDEVRNQLMAKLTTPSRTFHTA
jgi:hypothetical protein